MTLQEQCDQWNRDHDSGIIVDVAIPQIKHRGFLTRPEGPRFQAALLRPRVQRYSKRH